METLIAGRLLQYTGASVLLGSPLFFLYGTQAPNTADRRPWPWERRLILVAALSALIGALLWLMAETVSMSGEPAYAVHAAALWMVASETRFGLACCVRIALLLLFLGACFAVTHPKELWWVQVILGSAITMSFAWTGHGATEIGKTAGIHLAADLLHLLAAGIWIGALVPLAVLGILARQSGALQDGHALIFGLKKFSSVGVWVVAVLVFSGILNSIFLVDLAHWREVLNSAYGRVLLVKLALFSGMLGFAALHRYRTTPGLDKAMQRRSFPAVPVKATASSLLLETVLAAVVLGAVSILGTLAPPDVQTSSLT